VLEYRKNFRAARRERGIHGAIVAVCGFVLALGLSLAIQRFFHFEPYDSSGIVGWISVNKYPKQQEMFYYLSALIFIPSFTVLCWLFWCMYSTTISWFIRIPVRRVLRQDAFSYLPLLMIIGKFNQLTLPLNKLFLLPLGLSLAIKIFFVCYNLLEAVFTKTSLPHHKPLTSQSVSGDKPKKCESSLWASDLPPGITSEQGVQSNWEAVWSISASGLCIGFYVLLGYVQSLSNVLLCFVIPLVTVLGVLAFSLIYSFIVCRLFKLQFHNVLAGDTYSYIPAVLLLLLAVVYPKGKDFLLVIFLLAFFGIKLLFLLSKTYHPPVYKPVAELPAKTLNFLHTPGGVPLFRRLMEYVTLPSLIYVFFYGGGNLNQGFDLFYIFEGIDLFHEGERLAPLNELLRGGIPFRDIYIQHGLFQNAYRPLLASVLFGETLAAVRLLERLFVPLGYLAVYILGLQVFRSRLTALLAVFFASSQNFWVVDRHSLGLISIAFVASHITQNHGSGALPGFEKVNPSAGRWYKLPDFYRAYVWKLILGGIFSTLAFLFSTEIGLYSFAACVLFLLAYGSSQMTCSHKFDALPVFCFCAGALLGFLPFAAYFGWHFALDDLIWNTYNQCAYQIPTWGLKFPGLVGSLAGLESLRDAVNFVLSEMFRWYLPVLIFLIAAAYLLYLAVHGSFWNSESNAKLLLLFLAGIIFFRTSLGRSDIQRLIYGATFMWFISLFFLEGAFLRLWCSPSRHEAGHASVSRTGSHRSFRILHAILLSVPIVVFIWYVFNFHKPVHAAAHRLIELTKYGNIRRDVRETLERAGGIQLPSDQVSQIQQVVKYIQSNTSPDEPIFDFSNQGAYYFFANRPAVTRYHQSVYASTVRAQEEVIQALEKSRTKLVIFKTGGWFDTFDGVPTTDRLPLIARYLDSNYKEAVNINGTVILRRKARRG
jgi:hypothetical protein